MEYEMIRCNHPLCLNFRSEMSMLAHAVRCRRPVSISVGDTADAERAVQLKDVSPVPEPPRPAEAPML